MTTLLAQLYGRVDILLLCIMYNVEDLSVLYDNTPRPVHNSKISTLPYNWARSVVIKNA
jgi:hypothetical protein